MTLQFRLPRKKTFPERSDYLILAKGGESRTIGIFVLTYVAHILKLLKRHLCHSHPLLLNPICIEVFAFNNHNLIVEIFDRSQNPAIILFERFDKIAICSCN